MIRTSLLWMSLRAFQCAGWSLAAQSHPPRPAAKPADERVCIASAVAIDFETTRVLDWVAYHHLIGVDCFVLFYDRNHLSFNDSYSKGIFEELSRSDLVTMVNSTYTERLGDESGPTVHQVARMVGGMRYLAVIDVDEFIVTWRRFTLFDMLEELVGSKRQLGLLLNRWSFGTSGYVDNVPVKDMPEFFYLIERSGGEGRKRRDRDEPQTGKLIINLRSGVDLWGVHSWRAPVHRPDSHMLLPDGTKLQNATTPHFTNRYESVQPIWINHYVTGSFNQCQLKAKLGDHHRSRGEDCKKLHPGEKKYDPSKMVQDMYLADGWGLRTRMHREELFPRARRFLTV